MFGFRRRRRNTPIDIITEPAQWEIDRLIAGAEALLRREAAPIPAIAGIPAGAATVIHHWTGDFESLVRLLADAFQVGRPTARMWIRSVRQEMSY